MYHAGHQGLSLLIFAPIGYVLLSNGYPVFALLGFGLMIVLASFPDVDQKIRFVSHRGITHTLLFAVIVGGILAVPAFFLGDSIVVPGIKHLASLQSLPQEIATPLADNSETIIQHYNGATLAVFVFSIGTLGICSHLFGDLITPMGINPFWPVEDTNFSLHLTHASNGYANSILLVLGWAAVIAAAALASGIVGSGTIPT